MQVNGRVVGAGVAVAIAAGIGYAILGGGDPEAECETCERDGPYAVRAYPELIAVETTRQGDRETALSRGFLALSDYVFGKGGGHRLDVIAPVLTDGDDDGRGWRTRFLLADGVDPATVLEHCSANARALRRWDEHRASLHDVFVQLVGADPDQAAMEREAA